ncbi:unnamed protein product, partial [Onchocerca ochengi]|uniref:DUF3402 domain-containing protein n=1 Tax=Onchocerca ochengi TaxID=42157 RepID=A0A182EQP9_ONCOC
DDASMRDELNMSHVYSNRIIRPGYDLEQEEEQPRRIPSQQIQQPQENNLLQYLRQCQQWLQNIVKPYLSNKYRVERLHDENNDNE